MGQFYQTILIIVASIASLGILVGGIGYFISVFRKGTRQEKNEVINSSQEVVNFWKSQAENLQLIGEKKEKDWNEKFQEMSRQLGAIQGQLSAEKAQNERLEKIFQNRDPEHQKFMEFVITAIGNQDSVNKEIVRILGDIHNLAVEEHNRETKVETTITKS
jgi:cell shape-determining protein MreC